MSWPRRPNTPKAHILWEPGSSLRRRPRTDNFMRLELGSGLGGEGTEEGSSGFWVLDLGF